MKKKRYVPPVFHLSDTPEGIKTYKKMIDALRRPEFPYVSIVMCGMDYTATLSTDEQGAESLHMLDNSAARKFFHNRWKWKNDIVPPDGEDTGFINEGTV